MTDQDERQRLILTLTRDRDGLTEELDAIPTKEWVLRYRLLRQIATINASLSELEAERHAA